MKLDSDEVIVQIPVADSKNSISNIEDNVHLHHHDPDSGLKSRKKVSASTSQSHQQEVKDDDTLGQLMKTKSSFIEPTIPSESETENFVKQNVTDSPFETLETPKAASPRTSEANDDVEEVYARVRNRTKKRRMKIKFLFLIEFSLFVCITLVLILSVTMKKLEDKKIWRLELWKWCGLGLAVFCGRLLSQLLMNIVIMLIECNFSLRKHVLYFARTARKSCQLFIWLGLILITWVLLINRGVDRSRDTEKVLNYITRGIASTLVVAGAWILRTIVVSFLYASFYEKRFFERIEENIFHRYILYTLSGPPVFERSSDLIHSENVRSPRLVNSSDMGMKREKVSAWTMSLLIEMASKSALPLPNNMLDEIDDMMNPDDENNRVITNEWEAKAAAYHIFRNVARPGSKYIEEEDLRRFMSKRDAELAFSSIGGAEESGRINKKSFKNGVVSMYMKSKFLEHSLNDIKKAIKELNKFVTGLLVVVLIILWVILMGIVATEVLLFISSQFLLSVFTFGSSAKSTLESMMFVFVKHPYDVGDRCVIDGVQVVVEEVSILTTVFLNYDNEKVYYPNAILATKSISNFNRSPDMRDTVEFDLDVSTSVENISALKDKIRMYIESKPHLWRPKHSVRVREIEDLNKMKMKLYVTHTINFQDYEEKSDRRSNLVLELRSIFQELGIKYHILPPTCSD